MASLVAFFTQFWGPAASDAEKLGFAYMYDEDGTLLSETGTGGANSTGSTQYIYLPTASGPMPIAVVVNGVKYAVHADHLNTPRRLTDATGQAVWQWAYSAFGEEKPTQARNRFANLELTPNPGSTNISEVAFNLRYPGQYFDKESGLHYNGFRTYSAEPGRYTQADPIGLDGGWNRFAYVENNPLSFVDPEGLQTTKGMPRRPTELSVLEGGGGGYGGGSGRALNCPPVTKTPGTAPDFVVSPGGTAYPVPKGAQGPTPVVNPSGKQTGSAFTDGAGGANGQVDTMRIMNSAPLLWLLATLLRTWLHDETGTLSYALLFPLALAVHLLVVRRFVKAQVVKPVPPRGS